MLELLKSEYAVIQKLSLLALDRASQDGTVYTLYCLHCGHHLKKDFSETWHCDLNNVNIYKNKIAVHQLKFGCFSC